MGRLQGNPNNKLRVKRLRKTRPPAPPSSLVGTRRVPEINDATTSLQRWDKRKQSSNNLERVPLKVNEWEKEWANATNITRTTPNGKTYPLAHSKNILHQLKNPTQSLRHCFPKPPPIPPSALQKNPSVWYPSGRRRVPLLSSRKTMKRQRNQINPVKNDDDDDNVIGEQSNDSSSLPLSCNYTVKPTSPLPLHVVMTDTTANQVKAMEKIKNNLRAIFINIDEKMKMVKQLRRSLGINKDPTAMTTQQRVDIYKLQSKLEKKTKKSNTIIQENNSIRRNINDARGETISKKRAIKKLNKRLIYLKKDLKQMMLQSNIMIENEKLNTKIERMALKEESDHYNDERLIMKLYNKLESVKKRNKLKKVPTLTLNVSPRATIQEYQRAAIDAAAQASHAAMMSSDDSSSSSDDDAEEEEGSSSNNVLEKHKKNTKRNSDFDDIELEMVSLHTKTENLLKEAESNIRRKLSPISIRKMGAFARYAHEEQTGAFTLKDKKEMLSKIAKYNWKIGFSLYNKRKNEEIEHKYQLAWKRILHDNPHLMNIGEFVSNFLTFERRQNSLTTTLEALNTKLNVINMNNSISNTKLIELKKNNDLLLKSNNENLNNWKQEIDNNKKNIKQYSLDRIKSHELLKLMKPSIDSIMQLLSKFDPNGCDQITLMNNIRGSTVHDHQIHRTIGYIETTIDSMLLIKRKKKQDDREKKKLLGNSRILGGRKFMSSKLYHNGSSNVNDNTSPNNGKSRKGAVTSKEYEIHHLLPTSFNPIQASTNHYRSIEVDDSMTKCDGGNDGGGGDDDHQNLLHDTTIMHAPRVKYLELAKQDTLETLFDWQEKHKSHFV